MITKDKLALNLKNLKSKIPVKPKTYTEEHPTTIKEALNYYCNRKTVNGTQFCTKDFNNENWPLPLWFEPSNVKVGFWNKLFYRRQYKSWGKKRKFKKIKEFEFFFVITLNKYFFGRNFDKTLTEAFAVNSKNAFQKILLNPILQSKQIIFKSIIKSYKKSDWVACICTIFPLIDFVSRKLLKTSNLSTDVSKICKLFEQNGFPLENAGNLMPHTEFLSTFKSGQPFNSKERLEWFEKMSEYDFGLIGCALSSFIRFANIYYSYYKEDQEAEGGVTLINRHAILHGSINQFGSKVNTIKLLTFLYLILELESVFEILFAE